MNSIRRLAWIITIGVLLAGSARAEQFKIRGIKGLWWQGIEKYDLALPWLAEHDLNFLMLCYSSFPASGMDWRSEYTDTEKQQIRDLAARGRKLGVEVCFSFNPGIWSKPPIVYSSDTDCDAALSKVKTMHALGVRSFGLCLDDINRGLQPADQQKLGTLQAAQTYFVNRLWNGMKNLNPKPRLIFCPSAYTTDDMKQHMDYITAIGKGIDRDVMMFWTGPTVCSATITPADAKLVARWLRRKPFIWDNYPVNDMFPWRPLVSPLKNRSSDLAGYVSGYISNPMKQWYASTIPLTTTAAYLTHPETYNPSAEMDKVIASYPADQRRAIRLLVDLYGGAFWGDKNWPPQPRFADRAEALRLLPKYRILRKELSANPALANLWNDVKDTVEADIAILERAGIDRMLVSPLKATGMDFKGGAASVFGWTKRGVPVNYVYAKPTGKNIMWTDFFLDDVPTGGAVIRVTGINDDLGLNGAIRISLNDFVVHAGPANWRKDDFETKEFQVPASVLRKGKNTMSIRMSEEQGTLGSPPWFMVSEAELIPKTN